MIVFRVKYIAFIIAVMFSILLLLGSCKKELQKKSIQSIELKKALDNYKETNPIDIFSDIKFIKLETSKVCAISDYPRFFINEQYIISIAFQQIFLFDRNTGAFIRELSSYSKDPSGYRYTISCTSYHEKSNLVYARDWDKKFCGFDMFGKKVRKIESPYDISSFGFVNDSLYAGFIPNRSGNDSLKIVIFNKNGNIYNEFPQFLSYERYDKGFSINSWQGLFFHTNDNLFFKEIYNDTIFQVENKKLSARAVMKMDNLSPPYSEKHKLEKTITRDRSTGHVTMLLDNYIVTKHFCESLRFLLFEFYFQEENYWGFYDKLNNKTQVARNSDNVLLEDKLLPFRLTRAFINQKSQELITFIYPYEIKKWFDENPDEAANLPQNLQKLKNIKENDNPVLMLVKLKN